MPKLIALESFKVSLKAVVDCDYSNALRQEDGIKRKKPNGNVFTYASVHRNPVK
jgi:hypothetical protein